ncbi:hypothetical protein TCAL_12521, partial [Tigriopus californicus]
MADVVKRFFVVGLCLLILGSFQVVLWIAYPKVGGLKHLKKSSGNDPALIQGQKTILLYTSFFRFENWDLEEGNGAFQKLECQVQDCFLTNDRSLFENISKFDSVLFHLGNLDEIDHEDFYAKRAPHQKFVMFYLETPFSLPSNFWDAKLKKFFNWTMTYRTDSDVFSPYGSVRPKQEILDPEALQRHFDPDKLPANLRMAAERPGLVLWFVSNCHSNSLRETYVLELQKFIQVDIFGSCGRPGCQRGSDCDKDAFRKYKFYLSFENALCSDYVTEKLFSALSKDIVPIVLGGADYAEIVPPHSVINAKEFPNPQDLADYLLELDDNPDKYLEYFWWKDSYLVSQFNNWKTGFCNLCKKLNEPTQTHQVITNPVHWMYFQEQVEVCLRPDKIPWAALKIGSEEYFKGVVLLGSICFILLFGIVYALFRND